MREVNEELWLLRLLCRSIWCLCERNSLQCGRMRSECEADSGEVTPAYINLCERVANGGLPILWWYHDIIMAHYSIEIYDEVYLIESEKKMKKGKMMMLYVKCLWIWRKNILANDMWYDNRNVTVLMIWKEK